jgi:hypothetical protein
MLAITSRCNVHLYSNTTKGELTRTSCRHTGSLVAHDRRSCSKAIEWLANVAIAENGVSERSGGGIATGARVLDAHCDVSSALAFFERGRSRSSESCKKSNVEGN